MDYNVYDTSELIRELNEGLITPTPISKNQSKLTDSLWDFNIKNKIVINSENETYELTLYEPEPNPDPLPYPEYAELFFMRKILFIDIAILHSVMNGYYPTRYKIMNRQNEYSQWIKYDSNEIVNNVVNQKYNEITFEFITKLDEIITSVPKILYFCSRENHVRDILYLGLKPSISWLNIPPNRIYFSSNLNNCIKKSKKWIIDDYNNFNFSVKNTHYTAPLVDYRILKINTTQLKNITFRIDSKTNEIYTCDSIPPLYIKIYETVESEYKSFYDEWLKNNPLSTISRN